MRALSHRVRPALLLAILIAATPAAAARVPRNPVLAACYTSVSEITRALQVEPFEVNRFARLARWAEGRPVGACQVAYLLPVFGFAETMLRALAILAPHVVDRENNGIIIDVFPMASEREAARRLLGVPVH